MKFIVNLLMIKLRMIIFGNKKGKMNKKKKKNSGEWGGIVNSKKIYGGIRLKHHI